MDHDALIDMINKPQLSGNITQWRASHVNHKLHVLSPPGHGNSADVHL